MAHQELPESHERLLLSIFGTKEEIERYEKQKERQKIHEQMFREAFPVVEWRDVPTETSE